MYSHTPLKRTLALAVCGLVALGTGSSAQAADVQTVFIIAMENHNWTQPSSQTSPAQIFGNPAAPYMNSLVTPGNPNAAQVSFAGNYQNTGAGIHPSEPNYIWQEAGSNLGVLNDNDPFVVPGGTNQTTPFSLSNFLQMAGKTWRSYQEDTDINLTSNTALPSNQYTVPLVSQSGIFTSGTNAYNGSTQYNYAAKHNPMVFFTSTNGGNNTTTSNPLAPNYAPLQQLATDLAGNTVARYNWITPDQFNDAHSALTAGFTYHGTHYTGDAAEIAQGDNFLSIVVPQIMASNAYKNNGAIIIWWDETEGGDTPSYTLPEIVISPLAKGNAYTNNILYTHSSDLLTLQEIFGVGPCLRDACVANDLSDLFVGNSIPSAIHLQIPNTTLVYPGATNMSVCVTQATNTAATGTIQFLDTMGLTKTVLSTQPLQGNGCANWYITPGLGAGAHSITAVYSGDSNNPPGTSAPIVVTVNPAQSYLGASCGGANFSFGGNYSCNVTVGSNAGPATGSITYAVDGGTPTVLALTNGNAQFTLTAPAAGPHSVAIAYAAQGNFAAASSSTQNFNVTLATTQVQLTPSNYYPSAGTSFTLTASVSTSSDGAPSAGTVAFYDNGTALGSPVAVNGSGQATFTIPSLAAGYHSFTAQYSGATNFATGSSNYVTASAH